MVEKIPPHKHCQMCGKAVPVKEKLCSDECKQEYEKLVKRRKISLYIFYGAIIFMAVVLVLYLS